MDMERITILVMTGKLVIQKITIKQTMSETSSSCVLNSIPYCNGELFDSDMNQIGSNVVLKNGSTYFFYPEWDKSHTVKEINTSQSLLEFRVKSLVNYWFGAVHPKKEPEIVALLKDIDN